MGRSDLIKHHPDWLVYGLLISSLHSVLIFVSIPMHYFLGSSVSVPFWLFLVTPGFYLLQKLPSINEFISIQLLYLASGLISILISFIIGGILGWFLEVRYFDR